MVYSAHFKGQQFAFSDLRTLMAKASPRRSADELAGLAAESELERAMAQRVLAEVPLSQFIEEPLIPPEMDEVSRLILERHDVVAFGPLSGLTVGGFRDWLLKDTSDLAHLQDGLTPEMVAAVSKIMRNQDLISVSRRCRVVTRFRNTLGLPGRLATRLQPNHPTDDPRGIAASVLDGLMYGSGDAVIGINPATDNLQNVETLLHFLGEVIDRYEIPRNPVSSPTSPPPWHSWKKGYRWILCSSRSPGHKPLIKASELTFPSCEKRRPWPRVLAEGPLATI